MHKEQFAPLVSIIIPCYNQANYLPETLESVLAQSYSNWECIIVNDGSPDDTDEVAQKYCEIDNRFIYIVKENGGLSSARNFGIKNSKGSYLQFLDSDDLLENKKLDSQVEILKKNSDFEIVYSEPKFFIQNGNKNFLVEKYKKAILPKKSYEKFGVLSQIIKHNFNVVSSPLIARSLVEKVGMFDQKLNSNEDWDYWIRCGFAGAKFYFCSTDKSGTLIRVASSSMSTNYTRMLTSELRVRAKIEKSLDNYGGADKDQLCVIADNYMLKTKLNLTGLRKNLYPIFRAIFPLSKGNIFFVIKILVYYLYNKIVKKN